MKGGVFITVGTQGPFDRLIGAMDDWARTRGRDDVFAQIGRDAAKPSHIRWAESIPPDEFLERVRESALVVAHAGMGTIITALEYGRPVVVMPRRAALGEQRNDHQVDTARRFGSLGHVLVAESEADLPALLDRALEGSPDGVGGSSGIGRAASPELLERIANFIASCREQKRR